MEEKIPTNSTPRIVFGFVKIFLASFNTCYLLLFN